MSDAAAVHDAYVHVDWTLPALAALILVTIGGILFGRLRRPIVRVVVIGAVVTGLLALASSVAWEHKRLVDIRRELEKADSPYAIPESYRPPQ